MKEKIIKQMKAKRAYHGFTQAHMAQKLGVTVVTYSSLEQGKNVSSHLFWDAMNYLGIKTIE